MTELKLTHDPQRGATSTMEFTPSGEIVFKNKQTVPHNFLMQNASLENEYRYDPKKTKQEVARIPSTLYYLWMTTLGDPRQDETAARKWKQRLNDPSYRYLRVGGGQL